ncbi:SoxR reducing system RseC family protein [Tropicimonas sp. S265A]|uniref:SoxR reducing system RseC family protein n=1 Tax=Tropicimonas sp. S265A TaxID=3415134 RepID=UPI003C7C5759
MDRAAHPPEHPRRMKQRGRVVHAANGRVQVEVDPAPGCGACAARAGCGTSALAEILKSRPTPLTFRCDAPLQSGQDIDVSLPAADFIKAACLAFLLPATVLVGAIWITSMLALPVVASSAFAGAAFGLSFLPLWLAERRGLLWARIKLDAPE